MGLCKIDVDVHVSLGERIWRFENCTIDRSGVEIIAYQRFSTGIGAARLCCTSRKHA